MLARFFVNHAVVDVLVVVADVRKGIGEVQTVLACLRNDTYGLQLFFAELLGYLLAILLFDNFYVATNL